MSSSNNKQAGSSHSHKRKRPSSSILPNKQSLESKQTQIKTEISCSNCGSKFPSRNKLFRHLRSSCTEASSDYHKTQNETSATASSSKSCLSFHKVILVVAYLGKSYRGSARNDSNDSVPTVEGSLWKALSQALQSSSSSYDFALDIQEHTNPKDFTRCSRTDRGVSALGNVYAFLLPLSSFSSSLEDSIVSSINHHLPDDIQLLRFLSDKSIPRSFSARTCCESRRYRYLIPAHTLFFKGGKQKESIMELRKRLKKVLLQWGGTHSFHNFTNWKSTTMMLRENAITTTTIEGKTAKKQNNDAENGNADDDGQEPPSPSSSCYRHILRCHVEDILHHSQTDFVIISIKGQSFLYHQIRKMMGATIGVMNGSLPENFIEHALQEDIEKEGIINVPLAPAEGLVLVEAVYSKYCSKFGLEPIGLGTKVLHREERKENGDGNKGTQEQRNEWEKAEAKLRNNTLEFQKRVYHRICEDQVRMFS